MMLGQSLCRGSTVVEEIHVRSSIDILYYWLLLSLDLTAKPAHESEAVSQIRKKIMPHHMMIMTMGPFSSQKLSFRLKLTNACIHAKQIFL